jgi:5-methylthioadenosine/S-adenosylhomocysteine deaminase
VAPALGRVGMSAGSSSDRARAVDQVVLGRVITMNPRREVVEDGAVAIAGSDILAVGPRPAVLGAYEPARLLGGSQAIVIPGMIDTHTHCAQAFVRALTAGELPMIPRIYAPAMRALSPAQGQAAVRLMIAQLVRAGITTACEGTAILDHEEVTLAAFEEAGLRCCFARGAPDQDFSHASLYTQTTARSAIRVRMGEADRDLARTEALLRRYPSAGPGRIRAAINTSAVLNFSEGYLRQAARLAQEHHTTMHVHVARDREEVEFALAVWGRRPIERLADLDVLGAHLVAAHAVLATGSEIDLLGASGAALAHAPVECVHNLNAVPDLQRFRRAGVRVGLGCDGQGNDMMATMRVALLIHGALWGIPRYEPDYLAADDVLAMATIEAARVLGWDDRIGSLEPRKAADLVILDGGAPHLMATQDLVTDLVRNGTRGEITHVMVDGRLLFDGGSYPTLDLPRIEAEARACAAHVRATVADRRYRPLR